MMLMRFLHVNLSLNIMELFDFARNCNESFVLESIFFFGFFQQLHEQWMVDVKKVGSQTFVALLLDQPSRPNTRLECPYSFHGGDEY
jgi:hypothetical protein